MFNLNVLTYILIIFDISAYVLDILYKQELNI